MADQARVRAVIERLARIDRESCSPGEHEAAEWIAAALRELGAEARIERERVHGTYWWPLGLGAAAGLAGARLAIRGRRLAGSVVSLAGALAAADDLLVGRRIARRLLPKQVAANVVAQAGDEDAPRTLVVVAHHDAAHTSIFFDPRITAFVAERSRPAPGAPPRMPPVMAPLVVGPALAAAGAGLGARRLTGLAGLICGGIVASFAEIALRPTVPGANDNLTGVATLIGLAARLRDEPVDGVRVMLVSTGGEEALMVGMWAFARRHLRALPREQTSVLCVDTVGSPNLVLAEGEGLLRLRRYDRRLNEIVAQCAEELGVKLRRGMTMRFGTDGYLALRGGLPAALLTSVDAHGTPSNYHWPTDTPDRVDYANVGAAVAICDRLARRLARADS